MNTKVFVELFKGSKVFSIWEVDQLGKKVGNYPIISFGGRKAQAIKAHQDELVAYATSFKLADNSDG